MTVMPLAPERYRMPAEDKAERQADAGGQRHAIPVRLTDRDDDEVRQDQNPVTGDDGHGASVPRLRYAWRCSGCRRILFRHELPLPVIAALVGPLEIKCHCNRVNTLGGP